jgi:arsenate reductase-like glutaredoxin family protein
MMSLIMGDPRLIRRPLVVTGGQIIVGNDQAAFKEAFG